MPLLGRRKKDKAAKAAAEQQQQQQLAQQAQQAQAQAQAQAHAQAQAEAQQAKTQAQSGGENAPVGVKTVPRDYFQCPIGDLVVLVTSMLQELVELNDALPFDAENLTRFHSRSPPGISLYDYVVRIVKFCSLEKSILLSIIYFIDLLCTTYTTFSINSLTVHRFLITAAMVGTKGLCDSFCTNSYYARVGGLSKVELNLLEVEFLVRVDYRIVPTRECLNQYYENMVSRLEGRYQFEPATAITSTTTATASATPTTTTTNDAAPSAAHHAALTTGDANVGAANDYADANAGATEPMAIDSRRGSLKRPPVADVIPNSHSGVHHLLHNHQHIPPTSPKRFRGR